MFDPMLVVSQHNELPVAVAVWAVTTCHYERSCSYSYYDTQTQTDFKLQANKFCCCVQKLTAI